MASSNARQLAYQALKCKILDLQFPPGAKLGEAELAELLDMSRTPVRDVLARLTRENLVEMIPQRGAFVSRLAPARIKQAAWLGVQSGIAVLDALYIAQVSARDFLLLHHLASQMHDAVLRRDFSLAVCRLMEFHGGMYQLAGLELAWDALQSVLCDLHRVLRMADDAEGLWDGVWLECRSMAEALTIRSNAQATHALRHQFTRMEEIAETMRAQIPDYFK